MKYSIFILLFTILSLSAKVAEEDNPKPTLAFSFDDGNPDNILNYRGDIWNAMIVEQLKHYNIQAIWFVEAKNLNNKIGKLLLKHWDDAGNLIANHTCSHLNYNDSLVSYEDYMQEILKCDSFIKGYKNYQKIFRCPYLKGGNTLAKRDSLRAFLKRNAYRQGWVTIDNSDWYINARLIRKLKENPEAEIKVFKDYYISHIFDRAQFYNNLSKDIYHRQVKHTLLLHFNLTSALFLNDLIAKFKNEGWVIENYSTVIKDPIYNSLPASMPCEQSLIWSMARQKGKYEKILRYPGEDGAYEKDSMDKAGL
jgi:peptidoglycan/xylan/chitin deacetylase (PgdA/CDA1 family)